MSNAFEETMYKVQREFRGGVPMMEDRYPKDTFVTQQRDIITMPAHYTYAKMEVCEVVEMFGLDDDLYVGQALQYILRHRHKGDALNDLKKAVWHLQRRIKLMEERNEERD